MLQNRKLYLIYARTNLHKVSKEGFVFKKMFNEALQAMAWGTYRWVCIHMSKQRLFVWCHLLWVIKTLNSCNVCQLFSVLHTMEIKPNSFSAVSFHTAQGHSSWTGKWWTEIASVARSRYFVPSGNSHTIYPHCFPYQSQLPSLELTLLAWYLKTVLW